jgi:hypothetical protein
MMWSLRRAAVAENATAYNSALRFNAILWITTMVARAPGTVRARRAITRRPLRWRMYPDNRPYLPRSGLFS